MKTFITAAIALFLLAPSLNAAEQTPTLEQIKQSSTIRIGYRVSEPPMSFHDENGKPIGYSIDLCNRIVTAVKTKIGATKLAVEYVPVTTQNRFTSLTENKIDILCGTTTKTLARSELVDFTQLTFATGASLISLQADPVKVLVDLQGKKISVVQDTTTETVLKKALKDGLIDAEVVSVGTAAEGFNLLRDGKVNAYSSDQVVLIGLLLTSENPGLYGVSNGTFSYEPFAFAVRRNDADFRLVADRVLSQLYRSGQILNTYNSWFGKFSKTIPSAIRAIYQINATPE
jgi:glutamate/aspartate transport system substrate-binding protein